MQKVWMHIAFVFAPGTLLNKIGSEKCHVCLRANRSAKSFIDVAARVWITRPVCKLRMTLNALRERS